MRAARHCGIIAVLGLTLSGIGPGIVAPEEVIKPPVAKIVPKIFVEHGRERADNYDWLRDESDLDVIAYIKAENAYADARLARLQPLIEEIEHELYQRAEGSGESPEFSQNGYVY